MVLRAIQKAYLCLFGTGEKATRFGLGERTTRAGFRGVPAFCEGCPSLLGEESRGERTTSERGG